jgi:hypothetical protein
MNVQMADLNVGNNSNNDYNKPQNDYNYYNVDQYGQQAGGQIAMNTGDPYADPNNPNLMNLNNQQQNDNNEVNNLASNLNPNDEAARKEAEAKQAEMNKKAVIKENPIQKEFKNIFKGNDFYDNNKYRRRLMHLLFYCIVQDLVILEVLW